MRANGTDRLRLTSSIVPTTELPNASSQTPPRVAERYGSGFASLGMDGLYCLSKYFQPQDWARLRRISFNTMKALDACIYRYQVRPRASLPAGGADAAPCSLSERFHRLRLGAEDLRHGLGFTDMVDALMEATAWNHLQLDFASFKQSDQSRFKELISCLLSALHGKPPGWSCHCEMDLQYCRESLSGLLPRMAQSPRIGSFSITCDTDQDNMDFIARAPAFERLQINLLETREVESLAAALRLSRTRIRHLVLDGMPPKGDLPSLIEALAGKGLESLTIPEWSGANSYNQMGLRQAMVGFHFSSFATLNLSALGLWAVASAEDGAQLRQLLGGSRLHTLSLSGHNFEYLEECLSHALRHQATLRRLHLKFEFRQFPTSLIGDALGATGLQTAHFEIQYKNASAQAADAPRQVYAPRPGMRPGILSRPKSTPPCQAYRFIMERNGDGGVTVSELALPVRAFHALAPALARLACIRDLTIAQWEPGQVALAGELRRAPALSGLQALTLAGQGEFRFAEFPLDFNAQNALHLEFGRLDLTGFGMALGASTHLRALHLHGPLTGAAARELLQGLGDNASLKSLSARFDFADLQDHSLAIALIGALLKHPTLSQATIAVDSALHGWCEKLQGNHKGIALKFEKHYLAGFGNLMRKLQPEAQEMMEELIKQFASETGT